MKHIIILIALLAMHVCNVHAVLKEKDLPHTLNILRHELEEVHDELGERQKQLAQTSEMMRRKLMHTMNHANQNALMLYSQRQDHVFDLTYSCHEATSQYQNFRRDVLPFKQWVDQSNNEVARYDSLIHSLQTMPAAMLNEKAQTDRKVCLAFAINIRRMAVENQQTLQEYMDIYKFSETRLKRLNDYAQKRYSIIQNNIFVNGGENYIAILKNLGSNITLSKQTFEDKYTLNKHKGSQWDASVIVALFSFIIFYGIIAIILNQLVMRLVVSRMMKHDSLKERTKEKYVEKRAFIIMATTTVTFAVILNIVKLLMEQNFILMASSLMTELAWLVSVILISILIRVDSKQTMHTFFTYAPLLFMGFIVIAFRIVLIPNAIVNIIFPPLLLLCMLWQWYAIRRYSKEIEVKDKYFSGISLFILAVSVVTSWIGFTLLSVQILIWWIMQLTCILSITCIHDWYTEYAEKNNISKRPITKTWFYYFFTKVLTPIAAIFSVLASIYWAAGIFNLTEITRTIFSTKFIDSTNFVMSIKSLSQVIALWFVFSYINFMAKALIFHHYSKKDHKTAESRSSIIVNVLQVIIFGAWFLISLSIFHVSNQWIVVISGGLSTGIGFASKNILENIYYGVSLMAGRIKIGDMIVCDGTRGKVSNISYTSTMIEAIDGSIIAFTNSQLFTKNYKNLTRNHGYELSVNEVGVAYGTDIESCRQIITEAVAQLPCVDTKQNGHKITVIMKELADNCVTLKVVCWVKVASAAVDQGTVLECIYNTLNKNNIPIPFPQRDIHIIQNS